MATAKIATLAIRTLAKPIATQLKSQAAQHETFRNICISLAQRMHRTEMALRANLLPTGATQKVRPLNDAKAIANGANAISEGFLFFVAATLILGETYRGSRKKAEQRDRTEEELGRLKEQMNRFAVHMGVDMDVIERQLDEERKRKEDGSDPASVADEEGGGEGGTVDEDGRPVPLFPSSSSSLRTSQQQPQPQMSQEEARTRQLQSAVEVLLKLAIKNGWLPGDEGLQLDGIMRGEPAPSSPSSPNTTPAPPSPSSSTATASTPPSASASGPSSSTPPGTSAEQLSSPSVIQQVALERARALAREVRGESTTPQVGGLEGGLSFASSDRSTALQQQQQQYGGGDGQLSDLYDLLAKINRETPQDSQA
ncbi:uncharacterized protein PFL1_01690 [Pseudozyma flocculosa PF-1]|uniref:OPA3-domain-containing protein n=1 Tax=Pseudozyma flocculosa TaxID=84751 RepID=A0A5C3EXA3_9BASI|nr:uncharacterized protein PFL1_01690 [Pseudozyma flocculosa PF-1]EPQ30789.1 hypothetical protein PFL1_01690 [Pseudozyma flocculosa PF-1]SPO36848.1 uncharacterized protein PSFLO_02319 [Pseudozyma flocculosa]